jgi:hypothetical protein
MFNLKLKKYKDYRSNRTHHAPIRYEILIEDKNNELLILDELANYIKAISNINDEKWLEAM